MNRPTDRFNTESRYRMLVEAVTDYAIYMLDPDGFVVSWNPGAERLKGYTEAEIIGRHFSRFYPPHDVEAGMPARTLAIAAREGRFEAEGWRVAKGGRRFWAHVVVDPIRSPAGNLLGFAKVTRDLSERRVAEESLHRSEEQFRLLVQSVTDYAIYMLDPHGIVTNWNAGAQRIKGYRPDEVIGTSFSRFYRAVDRENGEPERALATAAAEGRFEAEGWRVRQDGTEFWANVVVDPIRDGAGKVIGFAKVTRDVTEKREAQRALERTREALFQSQKLDAIGQLTGGIAHDFNNLLMVVLSSLELLRRHLPGDDKAGRLIDNAVSGAQRGVSLTQRMLAFARRQDLKPDAVDVAALVDGMRDMLERTLGASIRIRTDFAPATRPALVDRNQLELAILNLAVNARDAMPEGGDLEIAAREETVAASAGLGAGTYVCVTVSDTGGGMDAETVARAPEPFFTTKGAGKGTGLGLPMVHGLAAQSGGRFVLNSQPGVGTSAELWLPVASAPPVAAVTTAAEEMLARPTPVASIAPLIVVAVDDDALVLAGTVALLETLGHTVIPMSSAIDALAHVRATPDVGLLLTDHVMPGMTGAVLIKSLAVDRPELPLILASGYGEIASELSAGVARLAKPFNQKQLAAAIAQALAARDDRS